MFDSFSFKYNTQTNLSIRLDQNDSSTSIEKLKNLHQQNFTAILNNPNQSYSFFEDIRNKLYQNIYDNNPSSEMTDLDKFEIDSPKSQTSGSNKSSKHSLKDLMNESFTSYIKKITNDYNNFKNNHYCKRQFQSGTDSSVYVVNNNSTNLSYFSRNNLNPNNYLYQPNSKVVQKIPKEFLTPHSQFKLSNDILEKKIDNLQKYSRDLIEICGEIDYEIEKILEHSVKLYNYINNNMSPIYDKLEFSLFKVQEMKKAKNFIKEKFIKNSSVKIKKEIKKRNYIKAYTIVKHFNSLKEILNLLKVLSVNSGKFKVTQDLILKAGDILEEIRKLTKPSQNIQSVTSNFPKKSENSKNNIPLALIKTFEVEFSKFSTRSTDNLIQEFTNILKEDIESAITIFEDSQENINSKDIDFDHFARVYNFNFNNRLNLFGPNVNPGIFILNSIKFNKTFDTIVMSMSENTKTPSNNQKLNEILSLIFKKDLEFYTKFRNIFTKLFLNYFSSLVEQISQIIYKRTTQKTPSFYIEKMEIVTTQDNNKLDMVLLLVVIKIVNYLKDIYSELKQIILKEYSDFNLNDQDRKEKSSTTDKLKDLTKLKYEDELNYIEEIITIELIKLSQPYILKNLNNILGHNNLDLFLHSFTAVFEIVGDLLTYSNLLNLFIKSQNEYLTLYFKIKEKKIMDCLDCEDWNAVQIVPTYLQKIVDFIRKFKLDEVERRITQNTEKDLNSITSVYSHPENLLKILKYFEENEKLNPNELTTNGGTSDSKNTIEFHPSESKVNKQPESLIFILTAIDIIKIFYDGLKMLALFHRSSRVAIITNLSNTLNSFVNSIKKIVLEGEGYKTGKLKRYSQKEISISCANLLIVKYLSEEFIYNNSKDLNISIFDELMLNLEQITSLCTFNIKNLLDTTFKLTFEELNNLNFSNYPVVNSEYPVNQFVKCHLKINNIYTSMINAFETCEIISIFNQGLMDFFENLTVSIKTLNEKNKMSDENSLKQFKRDMLAIKSNLKTFKILEGNLDNFRKKIDQINRIVLPKSLLKKKKAVEEEK